MSYSGTGQELGGLGGAALGTYLGGPVGGIIGGGIGKSLGGFVGGLFGDSGPSPEQLMAEQHQREVYARQQALAGQLAAQAAGQGPSLAGLQLGQGLDQINRGAASMAAGASGNNGVLAHYAAMQSAAQAGAQTNQAAAIARAKEINDARLSLGQVLGGMSGDANQLYLGERGANTAQQNADTAGQKVTNDQFNTLVGSYLNTKGTMAGGKATLPGLGGLS